MKIVIAWLSQHVAIGYTDTVVGPFVTCKCTVSDWLTSSQCCHSFSVVCYNGIPEREGSVFH